MALIKSSYELTKFRSQRGGRGGGEGCCYTTVCEIHDTNDTLRRVNIRETRVDTYIWERESHNGHERPNTDQYTVLRVANVTSAKYR